MSDYKSKTRGNQAVKKRTEENHQLSITSLLDVLTIILVFLMKNVSMETVKASILPDMKYPTTTTMEKLAESAQAIPVKLYTDRVLIGIESNLVGTPEDILYNKQKRENTLSFLRAEMDGLPEDKRVDACLIIQADKAVQCAIVSEIVGMGTNEGYTNIYFASMEDADWLKAYSPTSGQ